MWRAHFVVLGEEPKPGRLERLKEGYQLFCENRSGLYFLTAHSDPLGTRPDFSQFLEREATQKIDLDPLKQRIEESKDTLNIRSFDVSFETIYQAATLSRHLAVPVLVAEDTDDEYGMAALVDYAADDNPLVYLRFRTTFKNPADADDPYAEAVYRAGGGFEIHQNTADSIYGAAQAAIRDIHGAHAVNLVNFADEKPARDHAKTAAAKAGMTIKAYLDSFGVFKRISHSPPQPEPREKLLRPLRLAASFAVMPFLFTGMLGYVLFFPKRSDSGEDPHIAALLLIGAVILALPIWLAVWLIRAIFGL